MSWEKKTQVSVGSLGKNVEKFSSKEKKAFVCVCGCCWEAAELERKRIWSVMWKSFPSNGGFGSYLEFPFQILFSCWTVVSFNATPLEIRLVATGLRSKEQWEVPGLLTLGGLGCWRCFSGELLEIHTSHWPCPGPQALLLLSCSVCSHGVSSQMKNPGSAPSSSSIRFVHAPVTTICLLFSRKRFPASCL